MAGTQKLVACEQPLLGRGGVERAWSHTRKPGTEWMGSALVEFFFRFFFLPPVQALPSREQYH